MPKKGERRTYSAGRERLSESEETQAIHIKVLASQRAWLRAQINGSAIVRRLIADEMARRATL